MIQVFLNFEIGISILIAGLLTFLFSHTFGCNIIIVFMVLLISLFIILKCVEKRIWKEPSAEELNSSFGSKKF